MSNIVTFSRKRGTAMFKSKLTIDDLRVGMHVVLIQRLQPVMGLIYCIFVTKTQKMIGK